jgi:hypothetical protein
MGTATISERLRHIRSARSKMVTVPILAVPILARPHVAGRDGKWLPLLPTCEDTWGEGKDCGGALGTPASQSLFPALVPGPCSPVLVPSP